jgi:hypothetical protein
VTQVETPPRKALTIHRCARHREVDAAAHCDRCGMKWCLDCVRQGDERGQAWFACPCGGRCNRLEPEREKAAEAKLEHDFKDLFAYPFRGEGRWLLAIGAFVYVVVDVIFGSQFLFLQRALEALILGYQISWLMFIVRESARGDDRLPGFPEYVTMYDAIWQPLMRGMALLAVTIGPGALLLPMGTAGSVFGGLLMIAGAAVLPMALLSVAMADSLLEGLDPFRIVRSIPRIGAPYWLAASLFVAAMGTLFASYDPLAAVPWIGSPIRAFLVLYLTAVSGRVLGLTYARFKSQLGWY